MNEAVAGLVDDYVDRHAKFAFQEFNLLRVARDQVPSGGSVDLDDGPLAGQKLQYRDLIRNEIASFKHGIQCQFRAVFQQAAAENGDVAEAVDEALEHDPFADHVDMRARDAFAEDLEDYMLEVGEAMRPLLVAEIADPWDVVTEVCDREEAEERLSSITHHADVYEPYADDVVMAVDFGGLDLFDDMIDYSDEAIRVIRHGEDYVRRVIADDVRRAFES